MVKSSLKFRPGQIIHHRRYDYRGVIYDVDEECKADAAWYKKNKTQPNRDQPWYHVLVDGQLTTTYVAEENLELEDSPSPIQHPLVDEFFTEFEDGQYVRELDS